MIDFALLLGFAGAAFGLARLFRIDALPFLLAGGFALSLLPLPIADELLENAALLGLAFLVFLAAHELNPHRVSPFARAAATAALLRVLGVGLAGSAAAWWFGHPPAGAAVLGLAIGLSSPAVVVRLLEQRREFFEPSGRVAAGVLLIEGLLVILALPILAFPREGLEPVLRGALSAVGLVLLTFAFMRTLAVPIVTRLELDEEIVLLVIFSVLALFVGLAEWVGLPVLAGAFLAGIGLSRFPVNGLVRGYLKSTSDLATALAFTAIGALVAPPRAADLGLAIVLALTVLALTPALLASVGRTQGLTTRPAFRSGLLLGQTGEFSILVALQASVSGLLSDDGVRIILLVTALTMLLTPILSREDRVWRRIARLGAPRAVEEAATGHILVIGAERSDLPLLEAIRETGQEVLVLDDDPALVAGLRARGIRAIRADGSDRAVLEGAGAARARAAVVRMRAGDAIEDALSILGAAPVIARVSTIEEAERARELGAAPVLWAEPIAEDFLEWLERAR